MQGGGCAHARAAHGLRARSGAHRCVHALGSCARAVGWRGVCAHVAGVQMHMRAERAGRRMRVDLLPRILGWAGGLLIDASTKQVFITCF